MKNTEAVQLIGELYARVLNSRPVGLAIFIEDNQIKTQHPESQRYLQILEDYPGAVLGVYTKSIPYDIFVGDIMHFLRELKWI